MDAFVTVVAPLAPLHGEPRLSSPQVSQALGGHVLRVLEARGDWRNVRGDDNYDGWVHVGYLGSKSGTQPDGERVISLGCTVRGPTGGQRVLPPGAYLLDGDRVEQGEAIAGEVLRCRFSPDAAAAAQTGRRLFEGTPYVWGGLTPWGADCSGLVQTTYRLHGLMLPRDSWQQALRGEDAGTDLGALRAGDLLFFSDRGDARATHVGIAVGDGTMIHSAVTRGGFSIERLSDRGDPYVDYLVSHFTHARRPTITTLSAAHFR